METLPITPRDRLAAQADWLERLPEHRVLLNCPEFMKVTEECIIKESLDNIVASTEKMEQVDGWVREILDRTRPYRK